MSMARSASPTFLVNWAAADWTGCTQDRKYPFNLTDDEPTSGQCNTKWGQAQAPVHISSGCSGYSSNKLLMVPLTDDFADLRSRLDMMTTYAWTHIAVGVEFGLQMLSNSETFRRRREL